MSFEITSQNQLEKMFSKYQLIQCIKQEFVEAGFPDELERNNIPTLFGLDLLTQIYLHKRCNIETMVGLMMKHFDQEEKPAQACADMILHAAEMDLLDWDDEFQVLVVKYHMSDDIKAKLDMFQYPLPMIVEPEKVNHNRQTGYQTIKGSLILKDNHHDDDICLDHINRSNKVALSLDADIVAFVQNNWKNLDHCKDGEERADYEKRVRAFEKYDESSRDVLQAIIAQGNRFWMTHKYDKRGRTYSQGYHINVQGNDWNKACIQFADAEPLNKE